MTITPKTTVHTLLKEHPFLLDFLAGYHPEFRKLTNPVAATYGGPHGDPRRGGRAGQRPAQPTHERHRRRDRGQDGLATGDRRRRQRRHYGPCAPRRAARDRQGPPRRQAHGRAQASASSELIEDVEATEIAAMEQELIEGGVPDPRSSASATCTCRCSRRPREPRAGQGPGRSPHRHLPAREPGAAAGHGLAAQGRRDDRRAAGTPRSGSASSRPSAASSTACSRPTSHYLRKENQLFPFLEKHGVEGPSPR